MEFFHILGTIGVGLAGVIVLLAISLLVRYLEAWLTSPKQSVRF
jgi:hypothetical protein